MREIESELRPRPLYISQTKVNHAMRDGFLSEYSPLLPVVGLELLREPKMEEKR